MQSLVILYMISKPLSALRGCEDEDENIWMVNIIDRYLARKEAVLFDSMPLAEFASEFRVVDPRTTDTSDNKPSDDDVQNTLETPDSNKKTFKLSNDLGSIKKDKKLPSYGIQDLIRTRMLNSIIVLS